MEEGGPVDEMIKLWLEHARASTVLRDFAESHFSSTVFVETLLLAYMINELGECDRRPVQLC